MIDLLLIVTLLLMVAGILGSMIPSIPGPIFSIMGILIYWIGNSFQSPGPLLFSIIFSIGILALFIDFIASYIGADMGGASRKTAVMAAISAFLFLFIAGPAGLFIGPAVVIFFREIMLGNDTEKAFKSAVYTTIALLSSTVAKMLLTVLMLVIFLASIII